MTLLKTCGSLQKLLPLVPSCAAARCPGTRLTRICWHKVDKLILIQSVFFRHKVYKTILAGCKHSVSLTKAYLRNAIDDIDNKHPAAHPELFVDDTVMQATQPSMSQALDAIVPAILTFAQHVGQLKHGSRSLGPGAEGRRICCCGCSAKPNSLDTCSRQHGASQGYWQRCGS